MLSSGVVQVATSVAKKLLEPFLIQEAVFRRVCEREFFKPEISCGLVGLGSIGRAVLAALLHRRNAFRGVRPRCANWTETSEDVPPCGYSPGSTRRAACVDIFPSAHRGPWGLCFRNRLALLRPPACRSQRRPELAGFRAASEQSVAPRNSPPGSP